MTVSRLLGYVPVKLFDSGFTYDFSTYGPNYTNVNFEGQSTELMFVNGVNVTNIGQIANFSSNIASVKGLSQMLFNAVGQPLGGQLQTYIDDTVYWTGPAAPGFTQYYKKQPRFNGNWNFPPPSYFNIQLGDPGRFLSFGDGSGNFPLSHAGKKVIGGISIFDGSGFVRLIQVLPNGISVLGGTLSGIRVQSYCLACRNPVPGQLYDNFMYFAGTGPTPGNELVSFNSSSFNTVYTRQLVNMEDPFLDSIFQNMGSPNAKAYFNGFIFPLITNGMGVTKQYCETCVFTPDMSGYYILVFQPMDAEAGLQLSRNTGLQVKIDTDGIIWVNSGNVIDRPKMLFSFSSGFNFPVYYFGNLEPISLPCFVDSMAMGLYA